MLDYLVIAAHPDDAELAAGGTIATLIAAGRRVGVLDLTTGEPTPHGSPQVRTEETQAASEILRLTWRHNLGLPNRALNSDVPGRYQVASILRQQRPRVILAPYWEDAHPDHVAASALVDAARFWAKLTKTDLPASPHYPDKVYYYLGSHLRLHRQPSFVVDISAQIDTKLRAAECYHSQLVAGRPTEPPTFLDSIRDIARYWGWTVGVRYGEPFFSRELVGVRSLDDLL